MWLLRTISQGFLLVIPIIFVSACAPEGSGGDSGRGDDGGSAAGTIASQELVDPTPGAGDNFGQLVAILTEGNIAVSDPNDSSVALNNGAVHLYDPETKTRIASIYGDAAGDQLGFGSITKLANNNFVIASPLDNAGAGSVRLMSGASGAQIGPTIEGDDANDSIGLFVTALGNDNFVIASPFDDVDPGSGNLVDAGSVRLVSGLDGTVLDLIKGSTAGDTIFGLGGIGSGGIIALSNNNYVIASPGPLLEGSVQLASGVDGTLIGTAINGNDPLSSAVTFVTAMTFGNYVISSTLDNGGAGSVRLVNGTNGDEITGDLPALAGPGDNFGFITAINNNHFVITAPLDDIDLGAGLVADVGSVRLVNGADGVVVPTSVIEGTIAGELFGFGDTIALTNNNYAVASVFDDVSLTDDGSVRLVGGSDGVEINLLQGDDMGDQLSYNLPAVGITALTNNNFVIASRLDDEGGTDNGSVRLVDGATGLGIPGGLIAGDPGDELGSGGVTALANGDFVVISPLDDDGGADFGTARLVDGLTGMQIGATITGSASNDMDDSPASGIPSVSVTSSPNGAYYILGISLADNIAGVDSGLVRLIAQ